MTRSTEPPKRILMPLPSRDFDPTEAAVTWRILAAAGHAVFFASPDGSQAEADPIELSGREFGLLKPMLRADARSRAAYRELSRDPRYRAPSRYADLVPGEFDALVLPGGHARGMREYLESPVLQQFVGAFIESGKPVGAICHGVVLAARSPSPRTGRSSLEGRTVTALPEWMELGAWKLTRLWMGDYFRTYPETVEHEVTSALGREGRFLAGPRSFFRDSPERTDRGFVVSDGNLLTARWPGDAHRFATELARLISR